MIFELKIKDFILIEDVTVDFLSGLNIITGETGAGKSMILGAIRLILGEAASKDAVRIGSDKAVIKASFYTSDSVNMILEENGIQADDEIVVIAREIQAKGKSVTRINGQVTPLNIVRDVTDSLIDLHGQNENQKLLARSNQLTLLDVYGGEAHEQLLTEIKSIYDTISEIDSNLGNLQIDDHDKRKKIDFLTYQLDEIRNAKLKPDEDATLEREFEYLSNIETVQNTFEKCSNWLRGEFSDGLLGKLSSLSSDIRRIESLDAQIEDFSVRFKEVYYVLEDLNRDVESYRDNLEFDPERLGAVEKRLDTINTLKTKYGQSISEILMVEKSIAEELEAYEQIDAKVEVLLESRKQAMKRYTEVSKKLSQMRMDSAKRFQEALQSELFELNMKDTRFKIDLTQSIHVTERGIDEVEFSISTNPGQPFKPLKKVVSGGELSRLMLGIKIVLGHLDEIPTLIFDEIDTGISGITANVVGEKLARLARQSQIICITHLPQIAVFSDKHLLIEKHAQLDSTMTTIKEIIKEEIVEEIGRLVGGAEFTKATKSHAEEMLRHARTLKS